MASRSSKQHPVPVIAPGNPPAPRLLGVAAAAAYLGATVWAIRKLQWEGTISSIRIGQRLLFDLRDLDAFIEKQKA